MNLTQRIKIIKYINTRLSKSVLLDTKLDNDLLSKLPTVTFNVNIVNSQLLKVIHRSINNYNNKIKYMITSNSNNTFDIYLY